MAYEVITLNLIPSGEVPVIHAAQFDKNRPLMFALKLGTDDFDPSTYSLELQVRKVDNNIVTAVPASISNNVVTFNSTEQMTACSGTNLGEIQITKDDLDIATLHFYLVVQRDVLAGGVSSASDIYNLTEQIAAIVPEVIGDDYYNKEEVDEKIAEIPTFDPTNYYDKSDVDTLLNGKADVSDLPDMSNYYDKSEVDTLLNDKADVSDLPDMTNYYTKSEVDTKITDLYEIKTVLGSIAHFTDGGNNIPVKSLVSQIVAVQSGSGTPSPSNPRAISGFDSGVITRCGKNFIDTSLCTNRTASGVTSALNSNGSIHLNGTASASARWWHSNDDMTILLKAGTYTASTNVSGVGLTLFTSEGQKSGTFTLTSDVLVTNLIFGLEIGRNYNVDVLPQLEVGNQATSYAPYQATTYTFAFGQTVYGGHFDNKGNLVVTHSVVDLGTITFGDAGNNIFGGKIIGMKQPQTTSDRNKGILCSNYPVSVVTQINQNMDDKSILRNSDNVYIRNTDYNTASDFQNSINGVMLVYELATPITLSITSQNIPTLLGENNIFSNCGDVEVNYFTSKSDGIAELIKAFM